MRYIVTSPGGDRTVTLEAKNAQDAKRKACKHWDYKPGCPWTGIAGMSARREGR